MTRERHKWNIQLQREDGQLTESQIENYWDPSMPETKEAIGVTAAAQEWYRQGKQARFAPVAVTLA